MYMVRMAGRVEDWGAWPIDGAEERPGETWVYFSNMVVAKSFARANGAKVERARWEVNLEYQKEWVAKPVGRCWWLTPEDDISIAPEGRVRLTMKRGLVFGGGDHETTCGSLEMLERIPIDGRRVFDLGTGTGILSEAVLQLGAALAVGCDLEWDAAAMAHRRGVAAYQGPSFAMRDEAFDVVVSNIPGYVHLDLAAEYRRLLRPGGDLVLSGYYEWQAARIEAALPGLEKRHQIVLGDGWVASIFSHATPTASSD